MIIWVFRTVGCCLENKKRGKRRKREGRKNATQKKKRPTKGKSEHSLNPTTLKNRFVVLRVCLGEGQCVKGTGPRGGKRGVPRDWKKWIRGWHRRSKDSAYSGL